MQKAITCTQWRYPTNLPHPRLECVTSAFEQISFHADITTTCSVVGHWATAGWTQILQNVCMKSDHLSHSIRRQLYVIY